MFLGLWCGLRQISACPNTQRPAHTLETRLHLFCPFFGLFQMGHARNPMFTYFFFPLVCHCSLKEIWQIVIKWLFFTTKWKSDPQITAFLCRVSITTGCPKVTFKMLLDRSAAGQMIILTIFTHTRSENNDLTSQVAIWKSLFWNILYVYKT